MIDIWLYMLYNKGTNKGKGYTNMLHMLIIKTTDARTNYEIKDEYDLYEWYKNHDANEHQFFLIGNYGSVEDVTNACQDEASRLV